MEGQEAAIVAALADAQLQPLEIGYVEAHGTGTPAGDRVEIGAIGAVLGRGRAADEPLRVGSVKTNFGHTESAAGLAGLIKAVLAVREGEIAASLNYETPSTLVDWDAAPVRIASQAAPWPGPGPSRKAGVNGFGICQAAKRRMLLAAFSSARRNSGVTESSALSSNRLLSVKSVSRFAVEPTAMIDSRCPGSRSSINSRISSFAASSRLFPPARSSDAMLADWSISTGT